MNPSRTRSALLAALTIACLATATLPVPGGADTADGHWEILGEDDAIWVPAERPAVTYLPPAGLGAYHDHTEATQLLAALAADRPELFTFSSIGTSVDGRDIWLMRVTGPGDASERARVLADGAHHGNEVIGSETLLRFLQQIHADYDTNATMRTILDAVVLDVVPMINVDSIQRIPQCSHYAMCRKNSNGVDLNRNYADHWGGAGSSSDPGGATYRGPTPLSEPETQALAALIDANDYALHASFHSGTELILWPHGWTTTPPAEEALYQQLGDELTALTGVQNGQTARILYTASGTTMDQAAGSAAGWRALSFSPEAYVGNGNAFDWWHLFNPAETEAAIGPVVGRWLPFLWHLAAEAPAFAPATLDLPGRFALGPDAATLPVTVTAADRRGLSGASLRFVAGDAPVAIGSANPVPLASATGPQEVGFDLLAERGGLHDVRVVLDAGPAGSRSAGLVLDLAQVVLALDLARGTMGTPDDNQATAGVGVGPFDSVRGRVRFEVDGRTFGDVAFEALPGAPASLGVPFDAEGLRHGPHEVTATAVFNATLDAVVRPGLARVTALLVVERPQVTLEKHFMAQSPARDPLPVLSIYRNAGNLLAKDVVVQESLPPGYAYWFREGPVPLPQDPLGSPVPESAETRPDGSVVLTWTLGDLQPGAAKALRYRILPLVPGEAVLSSSWGYHGVFGDTAVPFGDEAHPVHTAR